MTRHGFSRQLVATIRCSLLACLVALSMPLAATAALNDQQQDAKPIVSIEQLRREAEAGDVKAQYALGVAYVRGEVISRDLAQAKVWLERAAAQDDGEPSYQLGIYHAMGIWGKVDAEQAFYWIERAAKYDNPAALVALSNFYLDGFGTSQNGELAIKLLTSAANKEYAQAQYRLGIIYHSGKIVPKDTVRAREWFIKAHEAGDIDAAFMVAQTYHGPDWKEHQAEIFKWTKIGASRRSLPAQWSLCELHYYGVGTPPDKKKAFDECAILANRYVELLDPNARFSANSIYHNASRTYITQRIYDAAYLIAVDLYQGEIVRQDCLAGRQWLSRVLEANNDVDITEIRTKAMRLLALDYKNGCSVKQDDAEAKRLNDAADVLGPGP